MVGRNPTGGQSAFYHFFGPKVFPHVYRVDRDSMWLAIGIELPAPAR